MKTSDAVTIHLIAQISASHLKAISVEGFTSLKSQERGGTAARHVAAKSKKDKDPEGERAR